MKKISILFLIVLFGLAAPKGYAQEASQIHGKVLSTLNLPIEGAIVSVTGSEDVKTGADGTAQFVYRPTTPDAATMVVHFDGQGIYDASDASVDLPASRNFVPTLTTEKEDILTFKFWAKIGFVLVIGGVWSTLLFILFQAFGISRVKARSLAGVESAEAAGAAAQADLAGGGGGS